MTIRPMKISEITVEEVAKYLRLERDDYDADQITAIMAATEQYLVSYTGIPAKAVNGETLDDHEDFYIAYMVLCQDMYDNRSMMVENGHVNRVVDSILSLHARNLL